MHRSTEILRPSRLYLDEHQHRSILGDQIQFTERGTEVLGDDPIALPPQIASSGRFSFLPKESSRVKSSHTIVRWVSREPAVASRGSCTCARVCATGSNVR